MVWRAAHREDILPSRHRCGAGVIHHMRSLFSARDRFYKGNLHTHSTRSDGKLSPEEVVAAYRERGYDFLALTDHFLKSYGYPITDTRPFRTASFVTLL